MQYFGYDQLLAKPCPNCGAKPKDVTTERWNGQQNKHCLRCGCSFDHFGAPKQPQIDDNFERNKKIYALLTHCTITPKIGTQAIRQLGIPKSLLDDIVESKWLCEVAHDLYFTTSRGKRFIEIQQIAINAAKSKTGASS